jgi:hypothetical protein
MDQKHKNKIKESIKTQISEQFSEYDHHNQKLFIQFFSAVFIVLIGYGYVYANQQFLYFNSANAEGRYTIMHLLAVYVVAQIILIFLSTLILNIGYCFRRDQLGLLNIRKYFFSEDELKNLFDSRSNSPLNKGLLKDSYLPTFNALFFRFIIFIQTVLLVSFILEQQTSKLILDFVRNHPITYIYILSFPIFINLSEYVRYYIKYKCKVDTQQYSRENFNRYLSLIQEGWATAIPILLLLELLFSKTTHKLLIIIVEVFSWSLLMLFVFYVFKILRHDFKK